MFKILYHWCSEVRNYKVWEITVSFVLNLYFTINLLEFDCSGFTNNRFSLKTDFFGLFVLDIYKSYNTDHAGWFFNLRILGLDIQLEHHDTRHWDYDTNTWNYILMYRRWSTGYLYVWSDIEFTQLKIPQKWIK